MKLEFDRLTRDATLAELTSLEALLAVMMSRGVVEDDVINKLWQVYSTIPSLLAFSPSSAKLTRKASESQVLLKRSRNSNEEVQSSLWECLHSRNLE